LRIFGEGGKRLNGAIVKLTDPDVIDSDKMIDVMRVVVFPPVSEATNAILLVKKAILTVDGRRSSTDIETTIALFEKDPEIRPSSGWRARKNGASVYLVTYGFIDGASGNKSAIWEVDAKSRKVRYINMAAKTFSWMPNY
jgi:hypothetical protein